MEEESIWHQRLVIEKRQREEIELAVRGIRARHRVEMETLRRKCTDHQWRFTNFGIFDHISWFHCAQCGRTKVEDSSKPGEPE